MPRHNLKQYKPELESTVSLVKEARDRNALCLNTKTRPVKEGEKLPKGARVTGCPCGCEGEPFGPKRTFLMGHDARLRGKLIRAHMTGTPVARFEDGKHKVTHTAMADAKTFGPSFVDALKQAEERRAEANKALLQKAMGSKRLIKVGRSEFTGQVVAVFEARGKSKEQYEVEYVDRQGRTKKTKVASDAAPVATKADQDRIAKASAPKAAAAKAAKTNGKPAAEAPASDQTEAPDTEVVPGATAEPVA